MLDAVVIGSGMGSLHCAARLARAGWQVVVLEQHYTAGGYAHSFRRGKYEWDAAVHYIGQAGPGGFLPIMLEHLGVADRVQFLEMDPDGFDQLHFPDLTFKVPRSMEAYRARLQELFPHEARGIDRYCEILQKLTEQAIAWKPGIWQWITAPLQAPQLMRWATRTMAELLDETVHDPRLRAVLVGQRGDYGENPSRASALTHSLVLMSYLEQGAYYPAGGSQSLVDALVYAITSRGGEVRTRTPVERICIEQGRAVGVQIQGGERLAARHVISGADLWRTCRELVGEEHLSPAWTRRLAQAEPSPGAISVYLGTDLDLRALGLGSENHWLIDSYEVETPDDALAAGGDLYQIVSVPTLKDPGHSHAPEGHHTLMLTGFLPHRCVARWQGTPLMKRGEEYVAFKNALADRMIAQVEERLIPGLSQHICAREVGTPLTNAHYVWTTEGASYGPAQTARQMKAGAFGPPTPIRGLWLAGANSGNMMGIVGSLASGMRTADAILAGPFRGA